MSTSTRSVASARKGRKSSKRRKAKGSGKRLSRLHRPAEMPLEAWQTNLRRQYGAEQDFQLKNVGAEPIFSDFEVSNPKSNRTYHVVIRGQELGINYCSCPDFVTNTLGTCKHIEFTLAKLRRRRGGKKAFDVGFQPTYSEVFLHYGAEREVRFRPGSDCPANLARLAARYFDEDEQGKLRESGFAKFDLFLSKIEANEQEVRVYDDVLEFVAEVRDAQRRRDVLKQAFPRGHRSAALKKLVKLPLYDYQCEGALFAARAGRCLIGDEMGLGKTIQAIAATEIMAKYLGVERVLIVCPTSLKYQWEYEIKRATDRSTKIVEGLRARREEQFATSSFFTITNYDTVHRDIDLINRCAPDLVILDEAQRIKNWDTRTARSVKQISSPYCLVLTGTPLENRLEELVSIVQFIDCHRLGPTFRFLDRHQIREEETGRVVGYRDLDGIGKTLEPILVRRLKKDVLKQLPERLEKRIFVPMTPQQIIHHDENKEIVARLVQKWRRYRFLAEADQRRLMIALQNMRMSCDSTYLLDHETDFGVKVDELIALVDDIYQQPDEKVVIFSQWVRMHELVQRRFQQNGWDAVFFHGGVPTPKRKELVHRFREDPRCRAFLATDAGGVGLNLQHASVVVNLDLPWNPAVIEQRIGRVHRLGQTRPVQVVNFVAQGTIEEGMLSILKFKKSLFAGVLDGGEKKVFLGKSRLQQFMETVEKATGEIPATTIVQEPSEASINGSGRTGRPEPDRRDEDSVAAVAAEVDPLSGLIQNGLALLEQLTEASRNARDVQKRGKHDHTESVEIVHDDECDRSYLKVPLPPPEVMNQALSAIGQFLEKLR